MRSRAHLLFFFHFAERYDGSIGACSLGRPFMQTSQGRTINQGARQPSAGAQDESLAVYSLVCKMQNRANERAYMAAD